MLAQKYQPLQIVIVDQSEKPDEDVLALVKVTSSAEIDYYHVGFRGLPRARNFGWQVAKYENIIFIDDDVKLLPGLIVEHIRSLSMDKVGIVAGGIDEVHRKDNPTPTRTGQFNYWTATPHRDFNSLIQQEVVQAPGGNFSLHKSVMKQVEGFDEALGIGAALYEETDFCLRVKKIGYKTWFNPNARLKHLAHETGGCRVPEVPRYLWSLSRNRMTIIFRHLRPYHWPTALIRLALLNFSYTRSSKNPMTLVMGVQGFIEGFRLIFSRPVVTPVNPKDIYMHVASGKLHG